MPGLPLPAYSFRATIAGQSAAFTEVSGLEIERDTVTYTHGLSYWEGETLLTYPSQKHSKISLKRGVFVGEGAFYDWLVGADAEERPMDVSLVDAVGAPQVTWRIKGAIPVKLTGSALAATGNDTAIDTIEVMVRGVSVVQGS